MGHPNVRRSDISFYYTALQNVPNMFQTCCSPRRDLFLDNDLRTIHYPLNIISYQYRCWSEVGRQPSRAQDLSIGSNCDTVATVEHELMHALGFWHEQSRYDRDNYITINWKNIEAGLYFLSKKNGEL